MCLPLVDVPRVMPLAVCSSSAAFTFMWTLSFFLSFIQGVGEGKMGREMEMEVKIEIEEG